jgi:hypothetical protein
MNYGSCLPPLANGAPAQRLRHLAQHLHDLGPRTLQEFLEGLLYGKMPNELAIVEWLERQARVPSEICKAVGGYELEPPVFDLTWTFRARLSPEELEPVSEPDAP